MNKVLLNTYKQRREFWEKLIEEKHCSEIKMAFAALNMDSAKVLKWHYCDGYSLREVETLLKRSSSIVRNHHNRGIFQLQQYFLAVRKQASSNNDHSL